MEQNKTLTTNIVNNPNQKSYSLDKSSLLIIVLLFMFSSKLWDIAWDIGKSLLYIIIIIYLIGFVNQDLADNIKSIIHDFTNVNPNNSFVSDLLAKISGPIKSILNVGQISIDKITQEPKLENPVEKFTTTTHTSLFDGTSNLSGGNTKNLLNITRSDSKNIFT